MNSMDEAYISVEDARHHTSMWDLKKHTGCNDEECEILLQEFTHHPLWHCSGMTVVGESGDFNGHLLPGVMFLVWATHWLVGAMRGHARCKASGGRRAWTSAVCQPVPWVTNPWPVEAVVKAVLPWLGIVLELWLGHLGDGYRWLICKEPSTRAGHLYGDHIQNYSHASMYLGFALSGCVDLISSGGRLPRGSSHLILGLAFLEESLLMGLHKKHSPINIIVHWMLTLAMTANSAFCFLEIYWPHNFLLICGRIAATYLQAFWLIGAAHILFRGLTAWDTSKGDLAPSMYAPIVFCIHVLSILLLMIGAYVISHIAVIRGKGRSGSEHRDERLRL